MDPFLGELEGFARVCSLTLFADGEELEERLLEPWGMCCGVVKYGEEDMIKKRSMSLK